MQYRATYIHTYLGTYLLSIIPKVPTTTTDVRAEAGPLEAKSGSK